MKKHITELLGRGKNAPDAKRNASYQQKLQKATLKNAVELDRLRFDSTRVEFEVASETQR